MFFFLSIQLSSSLPLFREKGKLRAAGVGEGLPWCVPSKASNAKADIHVRYRHVLHVMKAAQVPGP